MANKHLQILTTAEFLIFTSQAGETELKFGFRMRPSGHRKNDGSII